MGFFVASSFVPLLATWTRVAPAGANVVVQNLGGRAVVLTTSPMPPATPDGVELDSLDSQSGVLAADLYARAEGGGFLLLSDGFFVPAAGPAGVAPSNMALPAVAGTPRVGEVLSAFQGSWLGAPTSYAYQWKRAGASLPGAMAATYVPVAADIGATLGVTVTATNAAGNASATSASTAVVSGAAGSGNLAKNVAFGLLGAGLT